MLRKKHAWAVFALDAGVVSGVTDYRQRAVDIVSPYALTKLLELYSTQLLEDDNEGSHLAGRAFERMAFWLLHNWRKEFDRQAWARCYTVTGHDVTSEHVPLRLVSGAAHKGGAGAAEDYQLYLAKKDEKLSSAAFAELLKLKPLARADASDAAGTPHNGVLIFGGNLHAIDAADARDRVFQVTIDNHKTKVILRGKKATTESPALRLHEGCTEANPLVVVFVVPHHAREEFRVPHVVLREEDAETPASIRRLVFFTPAASSESAWSLVVPRWRRTSR